MNKIVIELQNIKRNFQVEMKRYMPCVAFLSPSGKESLSPSWEHPVPVSPPY